MDLIVASSIIAVMMGFLVLIIRIRANKRPINAKKILLPPLFMSTGSLMFLHPMFRVSSVQVIESIAVGIVFSVLLIKTSSFEIKNMDIYLKRSKAFIYILVSLLIIRVIAKSVLSTSINYGELSGMFWILAFGMIVPWRAAMFMQYKKIRRELSNA
ncbi:CcdC family protein [Litchfieldia salsa]|uniref:CcdC family protein n=1 Tax=Litchfieldia salsa TaxID=930152 RepID=UPI002367D3D5|nr:cytochrome c biogenesis protein CcdC [Litchfieldia salsa]